MFVDDLDCNVDSQTINSTAPPCSGRSSMAPTLLCPALPWKTPSSCCMPKEHRNLFCPAEESNSGLRISPSYLGLKFLLTAVKIVIILSPMFHTHHSTQLISHSQSWFSSRQELSYFNARFNSWEAQDCDTV